MPYDGSWDNLTFDEEFERFLKLQKGRGDYEKNSYDFRWLSSNYSLQLNNPKIQEVVIKIINKGATTGHLRSLMGYVSRTLESQREEQETVLYNQDNEEVNKDDFNKIIDDWSVDFEKIEIEKQTDEVLQKIDIIQQNLEEKRSHSVLNKAENEIYLELKTGFQNCDNNKNSNTQTIKLAEDKYTKEIGIVRADEFDENRLFYTLEYAPHVFCSIVKTESLINLKEIEKQIPEVQKNKPKNFSHIILSPGGDNPDPTATLEATKQFLEENFKSKGYDYLYTLHQDSKNIHVHVILNNQSKQHEYKFSPSRHHLHHYRSEYKDQLNKFGIDRNAVLKYDRQDFVKNIEKNAENFIKFDADWYKHNLDKDTEKSQIDLLKFRSNGLNTINFLSEHLDKNGNHDLALKVRNQEKEFKTVTDKNMESLIENTKKLFEKEEKSLKKFYEDEIKIVLEDKSKYVKDNKSFEKETIKENILEKHIEHLEKNKEELEKILYSQKYSPEITKRADKAVDYMDLQIRKAERSLGRGEEMSRGR